MKSEQGNTEQPASVDTPPSAAPEQAAGVKSSRPAPPPAVATSARPWLLWLVVIVLCGALGAFYWQQTRFSVNQSAAIQALQDNNAQLNAALAAARADMQTELEQQVGLLQNSAESLQQALADLQSMEQQDEQRVQGLQQRVDRQLQDTRTVVTALQRQVAGLQQRDTRLLNAEAAYLMRLADHKLTLENNPRAALQLLQSVEGLLRDQMDPMAQTARQSLQQDIDAIQSAQVPDRFELARRVSELASVLETVSVTGVRQQIYQQGLAGAREQTAVIAEQQSWTAALMNLFRSIFVWRQAEQNPLEYLPSDQESLIKLQMRLQFEQARFAVIQADQQLFEDALQQVAGGLQRYFMQDSEVATRLHDDVQALSMQSVQGEWPDIAATRALVEQLQGAEPEAEIVPPAPSQAPQSQSGAELPAQPGAEPEEGAE